MAIDFGNAVRPFHFASDFLTKVWTPDSDQKAVATAVAKDEERSKQTTSRVPRAPEKKLVNPAVKGLLVINFSPKSDAKKLGMIKGDIIIEYDGARDLTTDKFLAMTAVSRRDKTRPLVIFVRDGYEYSVRVSPGFIGISVMDTVVRGPFKRQEPRQEHVPDDDMDKKSKSLDWT